MIARTRAVMPLSIVKLLSEPITLPKCRVTFEIPSASRIACSVHDVKLLWGRSSGTPDDRRTIGQSACTILPRPAGLSFSGPSIGSADDTRVYSHPFPSFFFSTFSCLFFPVSSKCSSPSSSLLSSALLFPYYLSILALRISPWAIPCIEPLRD